MFTATIYRDDDGHHILSITGAYDRRVVHCSAPITLNPKLQRTRAEMDWAHQVTGIPYAEMYDAVRAAR